MNKINECWVIMVTYKDFHNKVNFNEAYTTYNKAKACVLKKIDIDDLMVKSNYVFLDLKNNIVYELKLVDIFD